MFSRFFIERPIFAAVVAIILSIAGLVSIFVMPVQQYPAITPVQVTVQATYPGADSKTLADSVAAPIEAQINGVDKMLYMTSSSSATGQLLLTVYFALDADPYIAQAMPDGGGRRVLVTGAALDGGWGAVSIAADGTRSELEPVEGAVGF